MSVFARVDELLRDVERLARAESTPFAKERADIRPDTARLLLALAQSIRRRMLAALDALGIERPRQTQSARWSVQTAFRFADIALSDTGANQLVGYGTVDPSASNLLGTLVAEVRSLVEQGTALLQEDDVDALEERMRAVPGVAGDVLRELARISGERDLVEIRGLLAAAAERALSDTFEVGVFGRVSTGKSSLINTLSGTPALPVGATPVTAVPLRVCRGDAGARVQLEGGEWREIGIDQIPMYATEEHNPDNRLGVRAIRVCVPTMEPGLCLLDTPGVGSLSSSGPAQAFSSLPRCDLGVVLIAAGTPIGQDERALVAGLVNAGIPCHALLSKADLLSDADVNHSIRYIERELAELPGSPHDIAVTAISTTGRDAAALDAFRRGVLGAALERHHAAASGSLRLRLQRIITLAADAMAGSEAPVDASKVAAHTYRAEAARAISDITDRLAHDAERIIQQAARALGDARRQGADGTAAVRREILEAAGGALGEITGAIERSAGQGVSSDAVNRATRMPPLFDPPFLADLSVPLPGSMPALMSGARATRDLQPLRAPLGAAIKLYAARLRAWGLASLATAHENQSVSSPAPVQLPPELAAVASLLESAIPDGTRVRPSRTAAGLEPAP